MHHLDRHLRELLSTHKQITSFPFLSKTQITLQKCSQMKLDPKAEENKPKTNKKCNLKPRINHRIRSNQTLKISREGPAKLTSKHSLNLK